MEWFVLSVLFDWLGVLYLSLGKIDWHCCCRASLEKVEEESRTLVANYEEQLSIMSDMLADMNGRLAAQGDTIHQLR